MTHCKSRPVALTLLALAALSLTTALALARAENVIVKKAAPTASGARTGPSGHPATGSTGGRSPHPATAASAGGALPPAHPATSAAPSNTLPPGHPDLAAGTGSTRGMSMPQPNVTEPSATVPKGSIAIDVVDAGGRPLANRTVRLGILRESIAEGNSHADRTTLTDNLGKARFEGLKALSSISYRVTVPDGVATYAADPFSLKRNMGEHVVLHVYPVTRNLQRALVGMRGAIYVEPREDVFQLEVLFSVYNIGKVTWVPNNVRLSLPSGWKAFTADDSMNDTRFVADGDDLALTGTFAPGEYDVGFRFQLPNPHNSTADLRIPLPPHVADMQVIVLTAPGMDLRVAGFPQAQRSVDRNGQRVLVTERQLHRGETAMSDLGITLIGLPTPGNGRWYAVMIAVVFIGAGLWSALSSRSSSKVKPIAPQNLASAQALLFDELLALERAHREQSIGPRSYDRTRRTLLDALARLEAQRSDQHSPSRRASPSTRRVPNPS